MTNKNSPSYIAGLIFAWCLILLVFAGTFYGGVVLQKYILGIENLEQRIDRIESVLIKQGE